MPRTGHTPRRRARGSPARRRSPGSARPGPRAVESAPSTGMSRTASTSADRHLRPSSRRRCRRRPGGPRRCRRGRGRSGRARGNGWSRRPPTGSGVTARTSQSSSSSRAPERVPGTGRSARQIAHDDVERVPQLAQGRLGREVDPGDRAAAARQHGHRRRLDAGQRATRRAGSGGRSPRGRARGRPGEW